MAAEKSMRFSDYVTARLYIKIAILLLPEDYWTISYNESRQLHMLLAKSAYSCADVNETRKTLQQILICVNCLDNEVYLGVCILQDENHMEEAYKTSQEMLRKLGEQIY
jgi:hypothetical protein